MANTPYIHPPDSDTYWIVDVRIPLALLDDTVSHREEIPLLAAHPFSESLVAADIKIQGGQIAAVQSAGSAHSGTALVQGKKGLVLPCFVDLHTHLDKGQTWNRAPNSDGTFDQAIRAIRADAQRWSTEDLYQRINFGLCCSYAHGTKAIRTHFDAFGDMAKTALTVLQQLQQEWHNRLTIQAVCLVPLDYYLTPEATELADLVAEAGALLGGVAYQTPELPAQLDRVFTLAAERQLALDFHVDETLEAQSLGLRHIAAAKLRHQFGHAVVCGHCCSLSVQSSDVVQETLKWVKAAEIGIVSLPACNLYLQDRQTGRMPRYRGVTLLHELHQQQIPVALASDNCRDAFHAYGDYDGLEALTYGVRVGHLDRPLGEWARAISWTPAQLMGIAADTGRIGLNQPADIVIFKARTFNELIARVQSDRLVLRQGKAVDTTPPDYGELDGVLGVY